MKRLQELLTKVKEATEVDPKELPPKKQAFLKAFKQSDVGTVFDGIHGNIVTFDTALGDKVRLDKKELQKMLRNKELRWADVTSVGF